jgi:hypothetical protein
MEGDGQPNGPGQYYCAGAAGVVLALCTTLSAPPRAVLTFCVATVARGPHGTAQRWFREPIPCGRRSIAAYYHVPRCTDTAKFGRGSFRCRHELTVLPLVGVLEIAVVQRLLLRTWAVGECRGELAGVGQVHGARDVDLEPERGLVAVLDQHAQALLSRRHHRLQPRAAVRRRRPRRRRRLHVRQARRQAHQLVRAFGAVRGEVAARHRHGAGQHQRPVKLASNCHGHASGS